jgi:enterochelin esterase-like enzyme
MKRIIFISILFLFSASMKAQTQGTSYESKTFYSNILKMDRKYSIYLPADYNSSDRNYPVLFLLHPAGPANTIPNQQSWLFYGGLKQYLDKAIAEGEIVPMIVVTPDANFGTKRISYFNDPEGDFNFEDFFFKEFIPFIEKNYRCREERGSRAIAGASMGGAAVIQYAIHQPDIFSVVCALSAAVRKFDFDYLKTRYPNVTEKDIAEWYKKYDVITYIENLPENTASKIKWLIICGDDDRLSPNNSMLHIAMKSKSIEHEFRIYNGAHDWVFWRKVMPEFMMFVSDSFKK